MSLSAIRVVRLMRLGGFLTLKIFPPFSGSQTWKRSFTSRIPGRITGRRAKARASLLNEPAPVDDTVRLIAELDAAALVIEGAESAEEVVEFLDQSIRVTTNRTCLENRDIPIDAVVEGVEILESSTRELVRLQDAGAGLVEMS